MYTRRRHIFIPYCFKFYNVANVFNHSIVSNVNRTRGASIFFNSQVVNKCVCEENFLSGKNVFFL